MFQKKHLEDSKILFKISALHTQHSSALETITYHSLRTEKPVIFL